MQFSSFGLAALGLGEWLYCHAGPGILLAVVVEFALGLEVYPDQARIYRARANNGLMRFRP
jgi:hypothetical protein